MALKLNFIIPNSEDPKHLDIDKNDFDKLVNILYVRGVIPHTDNESAGGLGIALKTRGTLLECVRSADCVYELRYKDLTLVTRTVDPNSSFSKFSYNWGNLNKLPKKLTDPGYNIEEYNKGLKKAEDSAFQQFKANYDSVTLTLFTQVRTTHTSLFELATQTFRFFTPRTFIKNMKSLGEIIKHAFDANNRSREAFTALGWIESHLFFWAKFTDKAPQVLKAAHAEQKGKPWIKNYANLKEKLSMALAGQSPERKFFEEIGWMQGSLFTERVPDVVKAHFDYRYEFEPDPVEPVNACSLAPGM
ncbi:hypothetical protein ACFORL_03775 [Legionella dresdenensis]|uniref:Substrate of the Dot/Icm secretion system n=1 Tax=Legionella dresdenensis TaxID=450200 RepID=A0ABV8CDD4_9GAMM